jgi:hypothetical protein
MGTKVRRDHVSTHLAGKGVAVMTTEEEQKKKDGRISSFFKKAFSHNSSKHNDIPADKSVPESSAGSREIEQAEIPTANNIRDPPDKAVPGDDKPKDSPTIAEETGGISKSASIVAPHSAESRRLAAERLLQNAADGLNQAIAKLSGKLQIPEAIGLQNIDHEVDDVAQTAKSIEAAIDGFIDARRLQATTDSRTMWKSCAANLFKAFYPYVKKCLKEVGVITPFILSLG